MMPNAAEIDMRHHLAALPMFSDLSPLECDSVIPHCRLLSFTRGDMIFRKGDACEEFHALISGRVKLYVVSASGQEKVVELVQQGHCFAEAAMFVESSYMLNARALTNTLLLTIGKQAVLGEIARNSKFSMSLLSSISQRIQRLLHDVEGYTLNSGVRRLIDYLLNELVGNHTTVKGAVVIYLPASKATIASRLSLTPEYFSRVLHALETAGLIEINKREIRILDAHRLAAYGGGSDGLSGESE